MVQHQDKTEKQDRIMDIMDAMDPEEDSEVRESSSLKELLMKLWRKQNKRTN